MSISYTVKTYDNTGVKREQAIPYVKPVLRPMPVKPAVWIKPERQQQLVDLFVKTRHKCLLGHNGCTDINHYILKSDRPVYIAKPEIRLCYNASGNPILNRSGLPEYVELYKPVLTTIKSYELKNSLYDLIQAELIKNWQAEDRENEKQAYKFRHDINTQRLTPIIGKFSAVSRDIYHDNQDSFFIIGFGFDAIQLKPYCKIRVSSTNTYIYILIDNLLKSVSKHKKRKALRYGSMSNSFAVKLYDLCRKVVDSYNS